MLAYHLSRPTKALYQDVDCLGVVLWSEGDSFDGVPRRPFSVGQQVGEFGGVIQFTPFVHICLELRPKGREFQHFPCKLRKSHLGGDEFPSNPLPGEVPGDLPRMFDKGICVKSCVKLSENAD
ncbi:hypothetical protein T02_13457 [Trichinella nativa]|uniref:Uncharacterized protein n=1 Tax=Trichinella nativa TaxID=6335 RepID=A0A0V1KUQ5_9BILA|nr:hypothetical protein T02_13457 [Trichinella nativa]